MDAVTFVKERKRICETSWICEECPLHELGGCVYGDPEEVVKGVEEWSKEHPSMTNRRKFEEVFGIDNQWIKTNFNGTMPMVTIPYSVITQSWWDAEYKRKTDVE